jgi:hypothetical protein
LSDSILHNYLENPYNERNTDHVLNLIKNAISIVQNLSRTIKINKKIAANIMLSFSKNLKFQEEHSIISYMFLAKIMREKGYQVFIKGKIPLLISMLSLSNFYYSDQSKVIFELDNQL